ncbi:chemotaxis protein CheB [Flavobacterium rivuli WB 3.3-2 = DSM 21788]|uniref:protein-glutamate methylesterase n=1 Tax=Flavobacterium rivuli WB 3.3-2 = DSM 21788 TaxID=1121895 RepID=A0A0A2M3Q7_9FLAO|nr:chemotaxis protein CheB [Flavobacterium rivuli]KGO86211.1 chemotaxis protein CheB [Flavobacterium rivuli WB 3.3-2 = DSM 21788]
MEENKIGFKVVIVGGSAGSLEVLMKVLPQLTLMSKFALVFVLHRKSAEDSTLEELIAMKTVIPVKQVEDKTPLLPGFIYVAPSDYHLLFETHHQLSLDTSEKVNYSRPSIDVSFESAAEVYGPQLTGILLSGANSDGTNGLKVIKQQGGTVVIQDPATAEMPFMPRTALENVTPDFVLGVEELLQFINNIK